MKKLLTLIMTLLLAVAACFSFTACGDNKTTLSDGKLTIGYTIYAPMNYFDNNEFVGFDTELAKAFCEELGVEADFVEINWDNKLIDLEARSIDCIWNGMTITEAIKEKASVSKAYLENKQVIVCRAEDASKFTTKDSIKNATSIAYEKGSAGNAVCEDLNVDSSKCNEATAQRDTLLEVKTGASEIAIIDITMAKVMVGEGTSYSDLVFVDVGFEVEEFGVAFRKSDEGLAKAFDLFVKYNSVLVESLQAKYFG